MNWHLQPGYQENLSRQTWEGEQPGLYWHPARRALSSDYQFDVYLRAREIAVDVGARSVLDVGSGPGLKAARLLCDIIPAVVLVDQPTTGYLVSECCPAATFVGADLEEPAIDLGRTFDVIICADVIEHLLNPVPCLQFIRRHSTAETRILLSTPERDYARGLRRLVCDKPEHVREWNGAEFVELLADQGFQVTRHFLSPTLRPEPHRGDMRRSWLQRFTPRPEGPGSDRLDPMRSCQVCECQITSASVVAG